MANLKAVLTRPKVSENYSRNAFDRSFSPKITYQLGGLTPFFAEPFIAGSHVKLNRSIFQRSAAVRTPAFPTVDTHCEFFYVPLRLLMSNWGSWKTNIQDFNSSKFLTQALDGSVTPITPEIPTFNLYAVKENICEHLNGSQVAGTYFANLTESVEANRLLDCLGYGYTRASDYEIWDEDNNPMPVYRVNPLKLCAYQKIYMDHFRNTAYESNNPAYYNLDYWAQTSQPLTPQEIARWFTYRYVNYRKDYFQSVYPALTYTVSSPNGLQWNIPDSVFGVSGDFVGWPSSHPGGVFPNTSTGNVVISHQTDNPSNLVYSFSSVQQIRAAFALDKLLRASAYAPKHVKDQYEARFGVKGVESNMESVRIGAFMNSIIFQEVTSQSDTSGASLGDVGGKGVGSDSFGEDIEFTCKEDCIIMGLIYSMPRTSYDSDRLLNWNTKMAREDFFQPEFMNLGMQPIYASEVRFNPHGNTPNGFVLGYKPRYSEYKVGIDVNHGLFNINEALSDFVVHSNSAYGYPPAPGLNYLYFKVKPTDLDSVFAQNTKVNDMTTDKFITYLDVKCICNQNMSVHGQPINIGG